METAPNIYYPGQEEVSTVVLAKGTYKFNARKTP